MNPIHILIFLPVSILIGVGASLISLTAWNLIVPLVFGVFKFDILEGVYLSLLTDLAVNITLTIMYRDRVCWEMVFMSGMIIIPVVFGITFFSAWFLETFEDQLFNIIGPFGCLLGIPFLVSGVRMLKGGDEPAAPQIQGQGSSLLGPENDDIDGDDYLSVKPGLKGTVSLGNGDGEALLGDDEEDVFDDLSPHEIEEHHRVDPQTTAIDERPISDDQPIIADDPTTTTFSDSKDSGNLLSQARVDVSEVKMPSRYRTISTSLMPSSGRIPTVDLEDNPDENELENGDNSRQLYHRATWNEIKSQKKSLVVYILLLLTGCGYVGTLGCGGGLVMAMFLVFALKFEMLQATATSNAQVVIMTFVCVVSHSFRLTSENYAEIWPYMIMMPILAIGGAIVSAIFAMKLSEGVCRVVVGCATIFSCLAAMIQAYFLT
ncbi:Transmembrane protein TauE-like protein [Aduncisulcus paluster]|uniref:Transmembrane protein TauE-like protein n=1 Tax=Aduncisulcus paluster TaxID=2918883 RepID=A0ABQ5K093_9EUKA|nr:Transmembrane protein TauE-like protein [Aduncisulcus paluster]